jgi:flagellar protein FliS
MRSSAALATRGADSYRRAAVEGCTPLERVVLLYDGAIRFISQARDATVTGDTARRAEGISPIVAELQNTLDLERGGEIASSLDGLYTFVTERLVQATVTRSVGPMDEALPVLRTLREGWSGAAAAERAAR